MKVNDKAKSDNTPRARLMVDDAPLGAGALVILKQDQAHYISRVMRGVVGDCVSVFNGRDGVWLARISGISKRDMSLVCEHMVAHQTQCPDVTVCFAPPRGGRLETILEKATELGARRIQPVKMQRSVVSSINETRAMAVMREAAEQCERMDVPQLIPMVSLPNLLGAWERGRTLLYADETGASPAIALSGSPEKYGILVGPEGGFAPEELALFSHVVDAKGVALGPRILRVDTAVITLASLVQHAWGDWQERPRRHHPILL